MFYTDVESKHLKYMLGPPSVTKKCNEKWSLSQTVCKKLECVICVPLLMSDGAALSKDLDLALEIQFSSPNRGPL